MTSGARSVLALLLLLPGWALAAWDVKTLMQEMAEVPSSHARFVETRHLAMLTRPLELKGSLTYQRPDRLAKHVQSPFDELLSVEGDALTVVNKSKGEQRVLSLREQPALGALVDSVRATLAGDLARLERHYKVELSGAREAWSLRLTPRAAQVRAYVDTITVAGSAAQVRRVEVVEGAGDRSVMTITQGSSDSSNR